MNERFEQLMRQADYPAPDIAGRANRLSELIVLDILAMINDHNVNRCVSTTYDAGVAECTRYEIIKALADAYGVSYTFKPSTSSFPVKGMKR